MGAIGSFLAQLHAWAAIASAVVAGLIVLLGVLDGLAVIPGRRWLDRLILALLALLVAATLLGPGIVIGVRPPSDPLHYLYAFIAVASVPSARYTAARRGSARPGWWVAVGGLVTLAVLLRLWGTGG